MSIGDISNYPDAYVIISPIIYENIIRDELEYYTNKIISLNPFKKLF